MSDMCNGNFERAPRADRVCHRDRASISRSTCECGMHDAHGVLTRMGVLILVVDDVMKPGMASNNTEQLRAMGKRTAESRRRIRRADKRERSHAHRRMADTTPSDSERRVLCAA